jgi:hypothetical protein
LSLLTVSFAVQKLFSFTQSRLFILSLRHWAFWYRLRKYFPIPICSSVFLTTSWSCFKVSGLMLRSLITLSWFWYRVKNRELVSVFYMWIPSFPSDICWSGFLSSWSCRMIEPCFGHWCIRRKNIFILTFYFVLACHMQLFHFLVWLCK